MVSVEEALRIIESSCAPLAAKTCLTDESLHHVLAADIVSPIDMPPFRQSAMDGYALHFSATIKMYTLIGEIAAGSDQRYELKPGEAVRIFTGSAVPDSANVVAQQEIVTRRENQLSLTAEIKTGQNIRPLGEQIKTGAVALKKGTLLNPAAVGYLATLGVAEVPVISQPKIGLLLTGNELVKPGAQLAYGQIYESNSTMLAAALQHYRFALPSIQKVADDLSATQNALEKLISQNDVVIISGGISVGDYDFVKTALINLGVTEQFYKVKQKPGKPLFFGTLNQKLVFALPGNPASALTCFYLYVLPALRCSSGHTFGGLKRVTRKLNGSYTKKAGLTHFLKSKITDDAAIILPDQSSAMLNTFALADGLMVIPEETEHIAENTYVDVYLF